MLSPGSVGVITPVIGFMGISLVMAAIVALGFVVSMLGKTVLGRRITVAISSREAASNQKSIVDQGLASTSDGPPKMGDLEY